MELKTCKDCIYYMTYLGRYEIKCLIHNKKINNSYNTCEQYKLGQGFIDIVKGYTDLTTKTSNPDLLILLQFKSDINENKNL